ncbi:hypothetical protein [Entomobacter blattae]|uniref:Uncharacterized protein n=1 Tax=Entomobacter blattae TaxID=2762277 RepID=A0A7H1NPD1_9PROT|nr:hypothetical protein [Entomobacter blattae]QNT77641.1 hypothetical protein JGUZn3_03900 [Entomobacter blattae]
MSNIVPIRSRRKGEIWAVIALVGKKKVVASIYSTFEAAQADCQWRRQQVTAYTNFLQNSQQPVPFYTITPFSRNELPKQWRPLPALGFLHGSL